MYMRICSEVIFAKPKIAFSYRQGFTDMEKTWKVLEMREGGGYHKHEIMYVTELFSVQRFIWMQQPKYKMVLI